MKTGSHLNSVAIGNPRSFRVIAVRLTVLRSTPPRPIPTPRATGPASAEIRSPKSEAEVVLAQPAAPAAVPPAATPRFVRLVCGAEDVAGRTAFLLLSEGHAAAFCS